MYAQKKASRPEKLLKGKLPTVRMSVTEQRMFGLLEKRKANTRY